MAISETNETVRFQLRAHSDSVAGCEAGPHGVFQQEVHLWQTERSSNKESPFRKQTASSSYPFNQGVGKNISRVCAIAQCAVLEANAKVNEIGQISHSYHSHIIRSIRMPFQIYHYVHPGSRCAKYDLNPFSRCRSVHA